MGKVKIAVVEDEIIIADHLCETLENLGYEVFEPAISYTEGKELIDTERPDIAILDINLSGRKDGIDLAKYIRENHDIPFIFLTSFADKATLERAKQVNPPAYLIKPFNKEELYTSIEIALFNYQKTKNEEVKKKDFVFVKQKQLFIKIYFKDILFLKSDHVYTEIFVDKGEKYIIRESLGEYANQLNDDFVRVHRSFIVNFQHITKVEANQLWINEFEVPISKQHRNDILEKLEQ
jgi:two-component system, LytTR family, response regulator LytT